MYYNNTQASTMQPSYPGHVDNAKLSGLALAADRKPISFFFIYLFLFFFFISDVTKHFSPFGKILIVRFFKLKYNNIKSE